MYFSTVHTYIPCFIVVAFRLLGLAAGARPVLEQTLRTTDSGIEQTVDTPAPTPRPTTERNKVDTPAPTPRPTTERYTGPPRIITRCLFAENSVFGRGYVYQFSPMEKCPDDIVEHWKCFERCLNSDKRPDNRTGHVQAVLSANRMASLRSWSFRTSGMNLNGESIVEEGQYTFAPSIQVDSDYPDTFTQLQHASEDCPNSSHFGTEAVQQAFAEKGLGSDERATSGMPDFSGVRHCARYGCVPAIGGWGSPGSCKKTMWLFESHVAEAVHNIDTAIKLLRVPVGHRTVVTCKYDQPNVMGSTFGTYVHRLLDMPDRPECSESADDAWKCFKFCPGVNTGNIKLVDKTANFDTGLIRPIIPSIEADQSSKEPLSYFRGVVLADADELRMREFDVFDGQDADVEKWNSLWQHSHGANDHTYWKEMAHHSTLEYPSSLDSTGWLLRPERSAQYVVNLKDSIQNAALELADATISEITLFPDDAFLALFKALQVAEHIGGVSKRSNRLSLTIELRWKSSLGDSHSRDHTWPYMLLNIAQCVTNNHSKTHANSSLRSALLQQLEKFVNLSIAASPEVDFPMGEI